MNSKENSLPELEISSNLFSLIKTDFLMGTISSKNSNGSYSYGIAWGAKNNNAK